MDDETLVRERFRYTFPFKQYGYEIVGEAEDGDEALELCDRLQPDIVITDIVMPRMDGLELTHKLKQKMPNVKTIILSNYQEFEFARKAVSYGAMGYMLKVSSGYKELLVLLEQARKEIEEDREKMLQQIETRSQFQQHIPLLRKNFILNLINQSYRNIDQINRQFKFLNMHPLSLGLSVAIVQIDQFHDLQNKFHSKDISLFSYALMQIIDEISNKTVRCDVFPWDEKNVTILLNWENEMAFYNLESIIQRITEQIKHYVSRYLPFSVSIGVSSEIKKIDYKNYLNSLRTGLHKAIGESFQALIERFYKGHSSILSQSSIVNPYSPLVPSVIENLNNVLHSINPEADEQSIRQLIQEDITNILIKHRFHPEEIIHWLEQTASEWNKNNPAMRKVFLEKVKSIEIIEDIHEFLFDLVLWNHENMVSYKDDYPLAIQNAIAYISKHYHGPINLSGVCDHVHMNANYFSHLFKMKTGMNFTDYVTHYRMKQAKHMLVETTLQIQEIAERIGIPDYKYFSRVFRRATGNSPSSYRKEISTDLH